MRELAGLSRKGICPVVFPEGTRSRDGSVRGFYAGALRVMLEHQAMPVLSVAVDGGYRIATMPRLMLHSRGVRYRVRPLTLYPAPRGKREIIDLAQRMEREISAQVAAWRREDRGA
jgi:1-acyl-sn-glycerol-3-phosphate acyltransferase